MTERDEGWGKQEGREEKMERGSPQQLGLDKARPWRLDLSLELPSGGHGLKWPAAKDAQTGSWTQKHSWRFNPGTLLWGSGIRSSVLISIPNPKPIEIVWGLNYIVYKVFSTIMYGLNTNITHYHFHTLITNIFILFYAFWALIFKMLLHDSFKFIKIVK